MTIFLLVLGLILFLGLVVIHEYGHFIMARRNGVEVEEFGIGFPPRLFKKRMKSGFDFTINLLPLGGFVRLKGEYDSAKAQGSLGHASLAAKTKIMMAGVAMNLIAAFVLLTIFALIGMPKLITKDSGLVNEDQFTIASDERVVRRDVMIQQVEDDSPAAKAGLKELDRLVSLGPDVSRQTKVSAKNDLPSLTHDNADQKVTIRYEQDGELRTATTTLRSIQEIEASKDKDGYATKGYLGVVPGQYEVNRCTWSAPIVAAGVGTQVTKLTFQGLGKALKGFGSLVAGTVTFNGEARQNGSDKASEQVSGPVGIFFVLKISAMQGFNMILLIIALISLTLAIMNVLPIPALDGGRLFVTLLFRAARQPLRRQTEEWIRGTGFAVLMLLFILITWVDVRRFM